MRVLRRALALAAVLYLATYACLSLNGAYERQFPRDVWRARGCWSQARGPGASRSTTLAGKAFYPLIVADGSLWHRTKPVIWDPL